MLDTVIRDARVLWRAESIVADIKLRSLVARSGILAGAGLVGIFGLMMLNVAAFFAAEPAWGAPLAATIVGCADFVLSGLLFFIASRTRPGRELDMAMELRQSALDSLEADARSLQAELGRVGDEIKAARLAAVNVIKHPLDSALPALVVPLATALLKYLRKSGPSAGS